MSWAGHIARLRDKRNAYRILWEIQKERDHCYRPVTGIIIPFSIKANVFGMLCFPPPALSSCCNSRLYTLVRRKLAYTSSLLGSRTPPKYRYDFSIEWQNIRTHIDNVTAKLTVLPSQLPKAIMFLNLYLEGDRFEPRPMLQLTKLKTFVIFLSSSRQIPGERLKLRHECFLLYPIQIIIHHHPTIRRFWCKLLKTSLNKLQLNDCKFLVPYSLETWNVEQKWHTSWEMRNVLISPRAFHEFLFTWISFARISVAAITEFLTEVTTAL
jgi:hypothetical protein